MIKPFIVAATCLLATTACSGKESDSPTAAPKGSSAPSADRGEGSLWDTLSRKASQALEAVKNVDQPRVVPKGAKPELIIPYEGPITFDGKPLRFGEPIAKWRDVLPKEGATCKESKGGVLDVTVCDWRSLGISVIDSMTSPGIAASLTIHINVVFEEPWVPPEFSSRPRHIDEPYRGYLEIDGYGVDKDTRFTELRAKASRRGLRCGLIDCSHPRGGGLNIILDGKTEQSRLLQIELGASAVVPASER